MSHYRFIDWATQVYLGLTGLLVLFFHGTTVPHWAVLAALHLVGAVLIHSLICAGASGLGGRWVDGLRHFYPLLLYTVLYRETGALNQMFRIGYLDPCFFEIDHRIFGGQPSLAFMDRLPYLAVSELFYASYFLYYVMIAGVGVALFLKDREQFFHCVGVISFVFYVCYLFYIFLPVVGPLVVYAPPPGHRLPENLQRLAIAYPCPARVINGPFYRVMAMLYDWFEAPGAAFPSSHVAIALVTLYFSARYLPRIRRAHFGAVILLCVSTVYCRYHYVVDVIAGALTAATLVPLGNWLYFKLK